MKFLKFAILNILKIFGGKPLATPFSGLGSILCFHRIVNEEVSKLNAILEVSSKNFENQIKYLLSKNYHFISLNQIHEILINNITPKNKFITITFDDGYADNYSIAYPILKKYNIPFTIYITTDFPDKKSIIWWYILEDIIIENNQISFEYKGSQFNYSCKNDLEKKRTFNELREFIIQTDKSFIEEMLNCIFKDYEKNSGKYIEKLAISWDQIIEMSIDPLVTFGAHTVSHQALSKLSGIDAFQEIQNSKQIIESKINKKVEHFAYPFGSKSEFGGREIKMIKKLDIKTAVNTLPGNIFGAHKDYLQSLPRIFMSERINQFALNVRISGVYPYLSNNFKKINICI